MNFLITGAGRGIGLAAAEKLAAEGHQVFAGVRDVARSRHTFADLKGVPIEPVYLDLTKRETILPAVEEVLSEAGSLQGLVNNAGISNLGPLEDQPDDEFQRIMDTNFHGPYHLTRAVLPSMRCSGEGRIVMVSSLSGLFGLPGETAYCCSKFAMEAMAECLRYEVSRFGIDVSVVNPSYTRTELAASTELDRATPELSPYRDFMETLLQAQQAGEHNGDSSDVVADAIVHALTSMEPRLRYLPGSAGEFFDVWKTSSDEDFNRVVQETLGIV